MYGSTKSVSEALNELEYSNYIDTHFFYGDDFERSYQKLMRHACSKDVWFAHRCLTEIKSINHKLFFMVDNKKAEALSYLKDSFESCIILYAELEDIFRNGYYHGYTSNDVNELAEKLQSVYVEDGILLEKFKEALKYVYQSNIITDNEHARFLQTIEHKMDMVMKETAKRISLQPGDIQVYV